MIHSLCVYVIDTFISHWMLPSDYKEWAIYVLEFRMQSILGCLCTFSVGCFFVPPMAVLAFLGSLYLINSRSGGYHCSSYWKCFVLSIGTTILSLLIANALTSNPHISIGMLLIGTFFLRSAPLNNKKINLSKEELCENRKKLHRNQCLVGILLILLLVRKSVLTMYVAQGYLSASLAILYQTFHLAHRKELS